jgi:hypothetical protein
MDSKLSSRLRRSEGLGGYGQKVDKKITAIHSLYILKQVAFVFQRQREIRPSNMGPYK